ncbi:MAG: hypothetical protein EBT44_02925 [Actinobacteria bacterium]|uniref:Uncharacterized protein n=1 Tax=Candidatus Fonsibacter lacus TaxID=2576439 RepID=A0A965GD85_9PROT|nr:hypothetical protein [Candidatus Fonsibacter lacus]
MKSQNIYSKRSGALRRIIFMTALVLVSLFITSLPSRSASFFDLIPGGLGTPGYYGITFEERQPGVGELVQG